jgi:molybdopterin synthase sulfur carrier subunit
MTILIPNQLQKVTGIPVITYYLEGMEKGFDIQNMFSKLCYDYPELLTRLFDTEGNLNKFVNIYVNDEDIRFLDGILTPLKDTDIVSIVPAMAGG